MNIWNDIVVGISFILLFFLVWKEVRRPDRRWRVARVLASGLAVIALACLGLSLTYMRKTAIAGKEGMLLTDGYDPDSVRLFVREHPGIAVIDTGANPEAGWDRWHVFGYGLTRVNWVALHPPPLVFHPSRSWGIVSIDWARKLVKGEPLRVEGRWLGRKSKLILAGMGSVLDSVEMPGGGSAVVGNEFSLGTVPAVIGRVVYHFIVLAGSDTLEREEIPVEVVMGKPLNILFLAASPDFENRFLINWLSKGGHGVASRTRISREKYDKAYVRLPELSLETLTPSLLDRFDLVIADEAELSLIGAGELSVLRREVREKGMGLIIKTDSTNKRGVRFGEDGMPGVGGVHLYGAGKLLYTTVDTTYSLVLSGKERAYAAYWSRVLGKMAREAAPEETWRMEPGMPRVGEPVGVWLQTGKNGLPQGELGGAGWGTERVAGAGRSVYLAEDAQLPFFWQGAFWPEVEGWNIARSLQGDSCWWYVWPGGGWVNLYREERRRETMEYMGSRADGKELAEVGRSDGGQRVQEAGWFYAVFLLCVLFLWVERKLKG